MDLEVLISYGPALASGFGVTLICWLVGTLGGGLLGAVFAWWTQRAGSFSRMILRGYMHVIRGIPFLIQLFILYYVLPYVGITLSPLAAGLIGMIVYSSPYYAEVFRAGLQAIPTGYLDAARAIGLSKGTTIWRIILPQVWVSALAPLTGLTIVLIKETAILSVITVPELLYEVQGMTAETFQYIEPFSALILGYWALSEGIAWAGRHLETRATRHLPR